MLHLICCIGCVYIYTDTLCRCPLFPNCHQVSGSWWFYFSFCSFLRRGHFSQSAWLPLWWQPLQPSDSPCLWWGPSFTEGGAFWHTAASQMPLATPASPTSVLLTPPASMWVPDGSWDRGMNCGLSRSSWLFEQLTIATWPQPWLCVDPGCVRWGSAPSLTQPVSHALLLVGWWQECWPDPVGPLQALCYSSVLQMDCQTRSASQL